MAEKVLARSAAVLQAADRVDDDITKMLWRMACEKEAKPAVAWLEHNFGQAIELSKHTTGPAGHEQAVHLAHIYQALTGNWTSKPSTVRYLFSLSDEGDEPGESGHDVDDLCRGRHPEAHWPKPCNQTRLKQPWGDLDYLFIDEGED